MTNRIMSVVLGLVLAVSMIGCGTGGDAVRGRVLLGKVGLVTTVDDDDPRLAQAGLGGVSVGISSAGTSVGSATTGPDGSFEVSVKRDAFFNRVELVARGDGVMTSRGSVYLPRDGQQILVFVERSGSGGVGEQPR